MSATTAESGMSVLGGLSWPSRPTTHWRIWGRGRGGGSGMHPALLIQAPDAWLARTASSVALGIVKTLRYQRVAISVSNPISSSGGVVGLKGTLAPADVSVKVAGMSTMHGRGPARCLNCAPALDKAATASREQAAGGYPPVAASPTTAVDSARDFPSLLAARLEQTAIRATGSIALSSTLAGAPSDQCGRAATGGIANSQAAFRFGHKTWKTPHNPYQSGALHSYHDSIGPTQRGH